MCGRGERHGHDGRMSVGRPLDWDGCWNARDLSGIRTADGREITRNAVLRSDHLHLLTPAGWSAVESHGIRTVIDLRSSWEAHADPQRPPAGITTVAVPLEDGLAEDPEFADWTSSGLLATPLYYRSFLRRWPDRCAAVGGAGPGGVVVHCAKGCDRTGMVVMFMLAICGVGPEDIVADYELTVQRLQTPLARRLGRKDDTNAIREVLQRNGCPSLRSALLDILTKVDVLARLRDGGLTNADVDGVRRRLLNPRPLLRSGDRLQKCDPDYDNQSPERGLSGRERARRVV